MITIAHISDFHCSKAKHGKTGFNAEKLSTCITEVNKLKPNVVVITGDLTMFGFKYEYQMAKKYLAKLKSEIILIPGNHDSRYCGYEYYDEFFGFGNTTIDLEGLSIVGIDTTIPDIDEGNVGRGKLRWLINHLKKMPKKNYKIVAMHHHILPVPHTGRERSTITDGGSVLEALISSGVNMVLCGHKHTPFSWLINNMVVAIAGSTSATKIRAYVNNSYNIIRIDDNSIEIDLKDIGQKIIPMGRYNKIPERKFVDFKIHEHDY
jgi:3',5'-cyclic AMP phosphodiesterase CpdA